MSAQPCSEKAEQADPAAASDDVVSGLLRTFARFHPRHTQDRITAAERLAIQPLTQSQRLEAERVLTDILRGKRRESRIFPILRGLLVGAGIGIALVLAMVVAIAVIFSRPPQEKLADIFLTFVAFAFAGAIFLGPITVPCCLAISKRANEEVRSACAITLGRLSGRGALQELSERLRDRSMAVRVAAVEAITEMLPLLEVPDAPMLSAVESQGIARILPRLRQEEAAIALRVLEIHGSAAAITLVEQFAGEAETPRLAAQAAHVIRVLEARRAEERYRVTLLRPSAHHPEQTLLRSSRNATVTDPALLLRESSVSENSDEA